MTTTNFAVIGNDGTRPVVWGVGNTEDEAREDARQWLEDDAAEADELPVVAITAEQRARIEAGEVAWPMSVEGQ